MSSPVATRLQIQAILALLCSVALSLLAVACVALTAGATVATLADAETRDTFSPIWWLIGFAAALLFGVPAMQLRAYARRNRDRIAALAGDIIRLSEPRLTPKPERAPDVAARPLVLDVSTGWLDRRVPSLFLAMYPALLIGLLGTALIRFFVFGDGGFWLQAMMGSFGMLLVLLGPPWRSRKVVGVAHSISADAIGLSWTTLLGYKRSMPWDEARLLEVARDARSDSHRERVLFTLYGETTLLRWRDRLDGRSVNRTRALLDLIAARTGLTPRTFDDMVKPSRPDHLPQTITVRPEGFGVSSVFPAQSPLSSSPGTYSLVWRNNSPRARRTFIILGTVLLVFDAVEILRILGALGLAPFQPIGTGTGALDTVIIALFLFALILGPPLFVGALRREKPSIVTATDAALCLRSFERTIEIPWSRLFEVERWELPRGKGAFRAVDVAGQSDAGWPLQPLSWPGALPPSAGSLVTSEEFAQIVARRIQAAAQPSPNDQ